MEDGVAHDLGRIKMRSLGGDKKPVVKGGGDAGARLVEANDSIEALRR